MEGQGELVEGDGSGYLGAFLNNLRDGRGRYVSSRGDYYRGDFCLGYATGRGFLSSLNF